MNNDMPIIYAYTRADAIEDGELVDVSETAREAGITYPVAMTRTVWVRYVEPPKEMPCQDEAGRLWDLCWMLLNACRRASGPDLSFEVLFQMPDKGDWCPKYERPTEGNRELRTVKLKAMCGPGDNLEPVITVMLVDED